MNQRKRPQAYENAMIYKEKTKRYHNKNLQKVILYNLRLRLFSGKLKSKWTDLFIITKVFPFDVVETQKSGDTNPFAVNGQILK